MEKGEKLAVSVEEAAAMLGLGRQSVYEGVRTRQIPSIKVGGRILVPLVALRKMLEAAGS